MTTTTNKTKAVSLDELWESAPISDCASRTLGDRIFNPESLTNLRVNFSGARSMMQSIGNRK
jgi:hypothetical protein